MKDINVVTFALDDNEHDLELMQRMLTKAGLRNFKAFKKAGDLLTAMNKQVYIAILDHDLKSQLTGIEVMQEVLKIQPACKIIIVSGQQDIRIALTYYENGAFFYIIKNGEDFNKKLVAKIREAAERTRILIESIMTDKAIQTAMNQLKK